MLTLKMITFICFLCMALSVTQSSLITSLTRSKRQACQDGTYQHNGMTCCRCAAGQRLVKHCTVSPDDRTCEYCEQGSYNSVPNVLDSCEPCTSCDPKANLEVEDKCTILRDTVCRCQQGFYCERGREDCRTCYPCQTCLEEGVKIPCTTSNDTICHEAKKHDTGLIVAAAVFIPLLIVAAVITGVLRQKKKYCFANPQTETHEVGGGEAAEERQPLNLKGVNLNPHIPDISNVLGWTDMRIIAQMTEMSPTEIEAQQLGPLQSKEWCLNLLNSWVERQGLEMAAETLVQTLRKMKKNVKAEEVEAIIKNSLNGDNKGGQNVVQDS